MPKVTKIIVGWCSFKFEPGTRNPKHATRNPQ